VRGALDHANVGYVLVKHPLYPRSKRKALIELTGQDRLPVIQFEDGTVLREDSQALVERIRTGRLYEGQSRGT
jgi:hypothetical protein